MTNPTSQWMADLADALASTVCDFPNIGTGIAALHDWIATLPSYKARLLFVGNGGSAAMCSHFAIDFQKCGGIPSLCFTDGAALTCLGNDLGFERVFSMQVQAHIREGDALIAISSSGRSENILGAVSAARARGCRVATFSGFHPQNPLRTRGNLNFWVPSMSYGIVETAHAAILHAILDTLPKPS